MGHEKKPKHQRRRITIKYQDFSQHKIAQNRAGYRYFFKGDPAVGIRSTVWGPTKPWEYEQEMMVGKLLDWNSFFIGE